MYTSKTQDSVNRCLIMKKYNHSFYGMIKNLFNQVHVDVLLLSFIHLFPPRPLL